VDVASQLSPLVAYKLVTYTFGSLLHLFLMVLILGQRRLGRLEWLLFWLMAGLFMWNSGNLLALNVGLFYGVGPRVLEAVARLIPLLGLVLVAPLTVAVHAEYALQFRPPALFYRLITALFCLPVVAAPWAIGNALGRLEWDALAALHPFARPLVVFLVAALGVGAAFNLCFRTWNDDPRLGNFHAWLAGLQLTLAFGLAGAYLARPLPVSGLGGYFPTTLMLLASLPGALLGRAIFHYNLLDLRVPRNVTYSIVAIFAVLLYINVIRRVSGLLELHNILPSAATEAVMIFILVVLLEPVKKLIDRVLYASFVSEVEPVQRLVAEIQERAKRTGDVKALQQFVEERAPAELRLQRATLRLAGNIANGPTSAGKVEKSTVEELKSGGSVDSSTFNSSTFSSLIQNPKSNADYSKKTSKRTSASEIQNSLPQAFPIRRGDAVLGYLDVVPLAPGLSGDQQGSLQLLADQLAAALELCQLIADKVKLERALAAKERMAFLGEMAARIAHNVKNPLSSMKTVVQLLEEDSTLPQRVREDCRMVTSEIDRLNRNISQVLRYAKPAHDTDRAVDLAAIVTRTLALSRAEAERRQLTLVFHGSGPCPVAGGEEAVSDILSNLIVNAVEASPPCTTVSVRLVRAECTLGQVALSVEDQGRGIPAELRDKIFQPFFTTRPAGTGLGLAIVSRRAEEIDGSVECLSPIGPQGGTRFVVRFRAAA
jgi:signal transduction histidine kinase